MDDTSMRMEPAKEINRLDRRLDRVEKAAMQSKSQAASNEKKLSALDSDLAILTNELRIYTQQIARLSLMTDSRNRIHILDHELESRYGRHAATRKLSADLLHAAGGPLWNEVRAEADGVMQGLARKYWLASAGLAFAAWLDGDRAEAERRVAESILDDQSAAGLFFFLIAHRFGRTDAATRWFKYYIANLNTAAMPDGAVQLFLAACDGVFGTEAARALVPAAREWAAAERAGQKTRPVDLDVWKRILLSRSAPLDVDAFPLLREYCPEWSGIDKGLELMALQTGLTAFYRQMSESAPAIDAGLPVQYDSPRPEAILQACLRAFLAEEKPLRRDLMLSWLLIEESGDLEAANARMEREWVEDVDTRDFTTFLSEMTSGAIVVPVRTERLAFALAFPWLDTAYESLREEMSQRVPASLELKIGDWSGRTGSGENESDLLASYSRHLDAGRDERKGLPQWLDEKLIIPGVLMLILTLLTANTIIVPLCALGGFGYYFYLRTQAVDKEKETVGKTGDERRRDAMALLTACLGEAKAFRKRLGDTNREMDLLRERMRNVDFPVAEGENGTERALAEDGVHCAALPAWDIEPPAA